MSLWHVYKLEPARFATVIMQTNDKRREPNKMHDKSNRELEPTVTQTGRGWFVDCKKAAPRLAHRTQQLRGFSPCAFYPEAVLQPVTHTKPQTHNK